jgi:hypothetical protein
MINAYGHVVLHPPGRKNKLDERRDKPPAYQKMMRAEALIGCRKGKARVQGEELMQVRCPGAPVPNDKYGIIDNFRPGYFFSVDEMLSQAKQCLHCPDHGNGKGYGYLPQADPVAIPGQDPEPGKKIKAEPKKIGFLFFVSGLHRSKAG